MEKYPTDEMQAEMEEAEMLVDSSPDTAAKIIAAARAWWLDRVPTSNTEHALMIALGNAWPQDENGDDEDDDDVEDIP